MTLGIYLLCLSIYLVSGSGHFSSTDQISVYLTTQSLIERGDLAIKPINDTVKGPDGRYYGVFGVGQSLASIPLYLVGRAAESIGSPELKAYWSGADIGDWGGVVPIYFVSLFNQFITPLTCVLVFLFGLKLGFSQRRSLIVTLVFAFATAAWVYAQEYFQHPLESLALLSATYILFACRDRPRPRHALFAGLALAVGVLTRINLILLALLLLVYLLTLVRRSQRRYLPYLLAFTAPIGLVLLIWMIVNHARFGSFLAFHPLAVAKGFSTPLWLGLYGNLFSAGRSIFLYSPPVILSLFAFSRFYRARRPEALLFAAIAVIYLLTYSMYGYWDGGWCWGPRSLVPTIPFLILPLSYLLPGRRWAVTLTALAVLGVAVQILGVAVNYSYVYWDWARTNLSPETAFLWVPEISAIPMHLRALLAGRHIDLWLVWVYQNFGAPVLLATLAMPLLLLVVALVLLRNRAHNTGSGIDSEISRTAEAPEAAHEGEAGSAESGAGRAAGQAGDVRGHAGRFGLALVAFGQRLQAWRRDESLAQQHGVDLGCVPERRPPAWLHGPANLASLHRALMWTRTSVRFRTALGIYLLCFAVYLMSGIGHFSVIDQVAVYLTTENLVERGDLAIKPIFEAVQEPDGRYYGVFGVGQSLASIPLYLAGRAAESLASPALKAYWSGLDMGEWRGEWGGTVPIYFVSLFNQFITPLTCVLVFLFGLKLGFSRRRSLLVTLIFAFATAAWVYAREYWQHPLESLALLTAVYILFACQDRLQPRHALFAGLALAAGILTRINLILLAPFVLAYLLVLVWRGRKQPLPHVLVFCAPIGFVLLIWMFVNHAKFGSYLAFNPVSAAKGFSTPLWLGLYGNLFSAGRSIFLYSPPVILSLFAFGRFYRARRAEAILFALIVTTYIAFYSVFVPWYGGWCWGPRFLVAVLPFLIIPLDYLFTTKRWAAAVAALAALGVGVQILGIAVNFSYVYYDWYRTLLSPETAFLWVPAISAIPMHLRALLAGRHIDLWLVWVYQNFGASVLLATLALPLLLLVAALVLLRKSNPDTAPSLGTEELRIGQNAADPIALWQGEAAPPESDAAVKAATPGEG